MSEILTSVILPSRARPEQLRRSIESLKTNALYRMEVLVAFDDDDERSIMSFVEDPIEGMSFIVMPRVGYLFLHHYVNRLALMARGRWVFLWNDDCIMESSHWDEILHEKRGEFVFLNPSSNHDNHPSGACIFPIVPRSYVSTLGHFSRSNHNDTYVEKIANVLGLRLDIPMYVRHERADLTGLNNDSVYAERAFTTSDFYGAEMQRHIAEDAERIRVFAESLNRT